MESYLVEKDLGMLIESHLNISEPSESWQCAQVIKKINTVVVCIRNRLPRRHKEVYLALVSLQLEYHFFFFCFCPMLQEGIEVLEHIQRRAMMLVKDLDNNSYQKQVREIGLFSPEKEGQAFYN